MGVTNGSGEGTMKRCPFCHGDGYSVQGEECKDCEERVDYVMTDKGLKITSERYWREKIADEIRSLDLKSEARQISSDWLGATVRTQMACASVAEKGLAQ